MQIMNTVFLFVVALALGVATTPAMATENNDPNVS
ncbi:MAG: hypothetical protein ACI8RD_006103 [Bacillariaceae sp.]|jgi:hypothetical protein